MNTQHLQNLIHACEKVIDKYDPEHETHPMINPLSGMVERLKTVAEDLLAEQEATATSKDSAIRKGGTNPKPTAPRPDPPKAEGPRPRERGRRCE